VFQVFHCLRDQHDWRLVLLAAVVCFSGSLVAVNIFHHSIASRSRTRLIWIAITGGAIGYAIWATHFIAMLAYDPSVPIGYSVALTGLSLAAAMALTSFGFGFAANDPGPCSAAVGGGIVGAGIASMHYLGMWAVEVPGRIAWSMPYVLASIVLGILFAMAALVIAIRQGGKWRTFAAAVLLTLAIVSHDFTAMGAVGITPDPTRLPSDLSLSPTYLAVAIAGVALSILGMSLIGVLADHRLATKTSRFQEIIRQLYAARQQVEASQKELQEQRFRLNMAINNMSQGLLMFDSSERITVCNRRYIEMYGLSPDVVKPGCTFRKLILHRQETGSFPGDVDSYHSSLLNNLAHGTATQQSRLPDGRSIQIINHPLANGGWVATHEDVTEQRSAEAKIAYMAHHDVLTGLANRATLAQKIDEAAARYRRRGDQPFSILLLDLDRFKYVNDTLGHPLGDALLREAAKRLKACIREIDVLGRLGGDEFAIIQMGEINQRKAASALANHITEVMSQPFNIGDNEVSIGASIGIALAPEHATDPDSLLKMADLALYRAKSAGRGNYQFFALEMTEAACARREVEIELSQAVRSDELKLHYQPIIDIQTNKICGAEALIRWHHPTKGTISPDQFIPLAEQNGLIHQIGKWVLYTACSEAATWPANVKIAINLSPAQLRKANLYEMVVAVLAHSGLEPARLELEITETALIESATECLPTLRQLKSLGVTVALDDFGTGYSSLSQLTMFPFDKVKIDRSFVRELANRSDCAAIVCAIANLGRALNIVTTAEGIETEEQLTLARTAGCSLAQGYFFGGAVPASDLDFSNVVLKPIVKKAKQIADNEPCAVEREFGQALGAA
jgi:diguanylate cyclase (GGDEF)-like protein